MKSECEKFFKLSILFLVIAIIFPTNVFAGETLFSGVIVKVIPPSILTFPWCPFKSIIVVGPNPGWFAVTPYPPQVYSQIFPFAASIGAAWNLGASHPVYAIGTASKTPCGVVPGIVKMIASTP